jgi:hypothetical protein
MLAPILIILIILNYMMLNIMLAKNIQRYTIKIINILILLKLLIMEEFILKYR